MLQNKHLIVLSGDARNIQVIKQIAAQGAKVTAIGFSKTDIEPIPRVTYQHISDVSFQTADAILLPVAGTDSQGNITSHNNEETIPFTTELLRNTREDCVIFSGSANERLRETIKKANRTLIPIFTQDDVAILNAIPTAEATLQIAMQETKQTIHGMNVVVVGFGRIGTAMAHLFHQVGANVTVITRKDSDLAKIKTLTYEAIASSHLTEALSEKDIIINTVPALLLDKEALEHISSNNLIIDVASKPGGVDFEAAEQLDIQTIHALGLPGKVAPITAGNIIADFIINKIS